MITALTATRAAAAQRSRRRPASPAELAARLIPGYRITPTIRLISDILKDCIEQPDRRYLLSCPPRTGKSILTSVVGPLYALMVDPNSSVLIKAYGDQLAEEFSGQARRLIAEHSELLGFSVDQSKSAVDRWLLAPPHKGGVLAGGFASPTTGWGASSILVCDDLVKGMAEADSPAHRRRLLSSFQSDILSRLEPGAGCLVIGTRFNELDIIGELLTEPGWVHINVPAVSEAGVPDALNRKPGVAMISALGRTAEGFAEIKRAVGQRAWAALYLGVPSAPEGGLIHRAWLDDWRLDVAPPRPVATCVAVDPSDSGQGDAAGVVACSMTDDGVVCLIADRSRPMTSDEWGREAVALAYAVGASQIAVEGYTTAETYARVVKAALDRHRRANPDAHPVRVRTWRGKG
ncbi:MAG: hypothetical protein ACLQBX_13795, partial [Candidatus Limnocylindrales bacterium]